ncbi:glycosyl hydrolase 115 family protein [Paraflavisolibacter sp. H34]|uniref:glycosyl hydrolase 115 family protein n=1 Tax=Huijunlia imazamoxiresistens TaxID=3127457 RepID=UPI003019DF18
MFNQKVRFCFIILFTCMLGQAIGQGAAKTGSLSLPGYIQKEAGTGAFRIAAKGKSSEIYVDPDDWKGVLRAAADLGDDVRKVTGTAAPVRPHLRWGNGAILVGTIGKSRIIDRLVADKKIDVSSIKGKWESFLIQTVDGNLVIAGSDKRGTIFGIYDVSEKIGVSPWYWWADAPVRKSSSLYVKGGKYIQQSPKVKYRGIFINDEEPSFGQWARARFGGINSKMYVHMFELLLRLKANYLWPAMWGKAFNEDDSLNPVMADEYGIVMGTSHHEPMMRAHQEYTSRKDQVGAWDYVRNETNLKKFFYEGIDRNKAFDNLVTVGMRGDGDVAMGKGDDAENMAVLRKVVADQREIIQKAYGKAPSEVPQLWAIFTEVQRYYDAGLNVPEDVTLLFCDNNWGYIRRTGPLQERSRKGGMGLYYHIDMNGGPWNDRWINTTTIPKLREQFYLAYQTGLDRIWIVNVGDLKPRELPIDFIMRFAWNPDAVPAHKTGDYTRRWAESIFGTEHSGEIAEIVSRYSKYNLWRKPEVQDPRIFSFVNFGEADSVLRLWHDLVARAEALEKKMPSEAKDAYCQLVLYPAKASAGVAEIYLAAGRNHLYAQQGRVSANDYARRARELFAADKKLSDHYNGPMAGGKWKHMMQDVHIGYQRWSMPPQNSLPELQEVKPLAAPALGVAVEGSEAAWPGPGVTAALPPFDGLQQQRYYMDVFNRGTGSFSFTAKAAQPWIKLSREGGTVEKEQRLYVTIDWKAVPEGTSEGLIAIRQGATEVPVSVRAVKDALPPAKEPFFGSLTGEFSIPACQYSARKRGRQAQWILLPDLGRSEGCMGISPVTAPSATPPTAPCLEYRVYLPAGGKQKVCLGILPTQDVAPQRGLRIAVSMDEGTPQVLDARKGFVDEFREYTAASLARSQNLKPLPAVGNDYALVSRSKPRRNEIFDNQRWLDVELDVPAAGLHTLKVFMVDPELVLEKIVINPDDRYPSYFGAPARKIVPTRR